jgi:hypothetical protein
MAPGKKWVTGPSIFEIKQTGLIESPVVPTGSEAIRGELDESGFRNVQILLGMRPIDCRGQILFNGNKIILDDGEKVRVFSPALQTGEESMDSQSEMA